MRHGTLALAAVILALAAPGTAHADYTSTASSSSAIMTGDIGSDTLVITRSGGGFLQHNRIAEGDTGYSSPTDFDSGGSTQTITDSSSTTLVVNAGGGDDTIQIGNPAAAPGSATLTRLFLSGESSVSEGGDILRIEDSNATGPFDQVSYKLAGNELETSLAGAAARAITFEGFDQLELEGGNRGDSLNVALQPLIGSTVFDGNAGTDGLQLAPGVTLPEGIFNGGANKDRLQYPGWTTPVAAELGTQRMYAATLDGTQEAPLPVMTPARGRAAMALIPTANVFELVCDIQGIELSRVTAAHIHVPGPPETGDPTIYDLGTANWVRTADGIALRHIALPPGPLFPDAQQPNLFAGNAYVEVHTLDHPAGEVRGQLRPGAVETSATGLAGLSSVEVVIGGEGDDLLNGDGNANQLDGGGGDDVLRGWLELDLLNGGAGDDLMIGNSGNDEHSGGTGDDVAIWQVGELSHVIDGDAGTDRLLALGNVSSLSTHDDVFGLAPDGARLELTAGASTVDIGGFEQLTIGGLDGTDQVTVASGVNAPVAIDGGDGVDTLVGGGGDDVLDGGVGADSVTGGDGGDEIFVSTGRGVDSVDGGGGADRLTVMGTNGADNVLLAGAGPFSASLNTITLASPISNTEQLAAVGTGDNDLLDASGLPAGGPAALLDGGTGNDDLRGGGAADVFDAGDGDDTLAARDGVIDLRVDCGAGNDTGQSDVSDPLLECETVARPEPTAAATAVPTAAPTAAPTITPLLPTFGSRTNLTIRVPATGLRLSRRTRVLRLTVANANPFVVTGRFELTATLRGVTVVVGRARIRVPGFDDTTATLRLSRKTVAALRRPRRVRATATFDARDPRGAERTVRRRVTLRRTGR